jgi:hypothetical protein
MRANYQANVTPLFRVLADTRNYAASVNWPTPATKTKSWT